MLPPEAPREGRPSQRADEPLTRPALLVAALAALAIAAGCGDDEAEPGGAAGGESELLLTLDADGPGGKKLETKTVRCPGDADAVCGELADLSTDDLEPVPDNVACTEIYGGPDVLTVEGLLEGDEVRAEFTRANGCEIERFDRWVPLLQEVFPGYEPGAQLAP